MLKLKPKAKRRGGDIYLLGAVVLLSLIGCVFIYSASSYSAESTYGDAFYFVKNRRSALRSESSPCSSRRISTTKS